MPAIKPTPSRRSGQEVGAYFCQPAVTPAIDRIDQPSVIDLRQATVLRMLEKTPERYSCEAVIRAQPGLLCGASMSRCAPISIGSAMGGQV